MRLKEKRVMKKMLGGNENDNREGEEKNNDEKEDRNVEERED